MVRLAYKIPEAAEQAGVSPAVIRAAIKRGDLIATYPTSHAVIKHDELEAWLDNLPTESPRSA